MDYSLSQYDEIYALEYGLNKSDIVPVPVFNFAIACDNKLEMLYLFDKKNNFFSFKKEEITHCELRASSKIITEGETTKKGSLSRSVVGGLVAGGTGAVVGAVTGKEKHSSTSQEILTYSLDVYTTNTDLPFFTIRGLETDLKKWNGYILIMTTTNI